MFSNIDKSIFFIASFSPLWAIMIVGHMLNNYANQHSWMASLILSAVVAFSIVFVVRKFRALRRSTNPKCVKVTKVREITVEYIPYVISYLFPILVQFDDLSRIVTVLAAIVLVAILYIKTRMVLTNPALLIAGFRLYEVNAVSYARPFIIISKRYPAEDVWIRDMDHDLCIEQKRQDH